MAMNMNTKKLLLLNFLLLLTIPISSVHADRSCEQSQNSDRNKTESVKLKLIAVATILTCGAIGFTLPTLSKFIPILSPKNDVFFVIKSFAAGVILATGCVHVLPDAFESLNSPCLKENPWGSFPFAGLFAMVGAVGTRMLDAFATSHHMRTHLNKEEGFDKDIENGGGGNVHVHTHSTHGHAHGSSDLVDQNSSQLLRNRVVSQVLELGIIVHSVIIGISLGASLSPNTIKPLVIALTFHQMFEGMGLGGCISQANFKARTIVTMAIFFSLTTPIGIIIGFGTSNIYNENSPEALIVEGILNSTSAGILICMALVDLVAADFMNPRVQSNLKLQTGVSFSLLLGMGCMSLLAIWA